MHPGPMFGLARFQALISQANQKWTRSCGVWGEMLMSSAAKSADHLGPARLAGQKNLVGLCDHSLCPTGVLTNLILHFLAVPSLL